eukprot:8584847-Alexandrium_andersonii.AAC.1
MSVDVRGRITTYQDAPGYAQPRRITMYYDVLRRAATYYDVLRRATTHYDVRGRTRTYKGTLR